MKNRWYQRFSIGGVTLFFAATALLLHGNKTESPGMFLASGIFLALAYVLSSPPA